jgi:hypothetical protein
MIFDLLRILMATFDNVGVFNPADCPIPIKATPLSEPPT